MVPSVPDYRSRFHWQCDYCSYLPHIGSQEHPSLASSLHRAAGVLGVCCAAGRHHCYGHSGCEWVWSPGAGNGGSCQTQEATETDSTGPAGLEGEGWKREGDR